MRFHSAVSALFLLLLFSVPLKPCFGQTPRSMPGIPPLHQPPAPDDEERARIEKEMAKKENRERQAQLKRDTENLLKLATELKQYVDKSNENVLSVEVIKKAEDIERLAHSVKEKMKGN